MNTAVNQLTISVFKKPLDECSADEIRQLTHQYPWFGPGQLLLAKKLQADNSSLYEEQVQKTSLYFQNRLWLHHLLNDNGTQGIVVRNQPKAEEKITAENTEQNKGEFREEPVFNSPEEAASLTELFIEEPAEQDQTRQPSEPALNNAEGMEVVAAPLNAETAEQDQTEQPAEPVLNEVNETEVIAATFHEEPAVQTEPEPALVMPQLKIEPLAPGAKLVFEPYHTVDYFASLGIKFKDEEKPKDLFGQQLKSFTEWLKTMKRVPMSEIPTVAEASVEKKVEQMAEHSLAERHVITEAMAEVWEKQGDTAKAEEIYHKLSLLDPLKTAYFAAKIDALKKTS